MIIVVMGVAGSGKTHIGTLLADALGFDFLDGDSLHSMESIEAMGKGVPLTDAGRAPWLAAIRAGMLGALARDQGLVVACSALKQSYRRFLSDGIAVTWVYLRGTISLIRARLDARTTHFMKADMLASQVEVLEEPSDAIVVDIASDPDTIVEQILSELQ